MCGNGMCGIDGCCGDEGGSIVSYQDVGLLVDDAILAYSERVEFARRMFLDDMRTIIRRVVHSMFREGVVNEAEDICEYVRRRCDEVIPGVVMSVREFGGGVVADCLLMNMDGFLSTEQSNPDVINLLDGDHTTFEVRADISGAW